MNIVSNHTADFNDSTVEPVRRPHNLADSTGDKVSVRVAPGRRTLVRVIYTDGDDTSLLRGVEYDELCGPPDASGYRVCGTKLSAYPRKGEPEPVWIEMTFAEAVAASGEAVGK